MPKVRSLRTISLSVVCPHCGSEVSLDLTKSEVEAILKGFSLPEEKAQAYIEEKLNKR